MAFYDTTWYCNAGDQSTTGHYAVAKRPQNTAVAAGVVRRQFTAPAVGNERCFVCIVAGTTANVADATWVLTRGAKTVDGTATWQECTGASAVNGDLTNTVTWTQAKAIGVPTLGAIIKRNNGASYQICTTAGTMGASEPAFSNTAGVTTTETAGTAVWTCLGVVGNFTGGQAPHARLGNVFGTSWWVAGNAIYVGDNHAESQATAISISPIAAYADNNRILCHNHSGSYPPAAGDLTTGATISTTAAVNLTFGASGSWYFYGITFRGGVGAASLGFLILGGSSSWYYFDNCSLQVAATGGANIQFSAGIGGTYILNNTTVKFANTGSYVDAEGCQLTWQNTGQVLVAGSAVPSSLIAQNLNARTCTVTLEAIDLSQITGNIFGAVQAGAYGVWLVKDCKLNATTIPYGAAGGLPANPGHIIQLVRCDSGATAYKSARYLFEGSEVTETSITRVGGAVDPTGQAQSRKVVTVTNALWLRPFKAEPYAAWNTRTAANVVVTVYGTINAGAVPNTDDIWLEVEYLGSSASPLGNIVNTTKANLLAANAAVASDNSTWNGGGSGAGWSPFKLVATLSSPQPGLAGYLHVRVKAAKLSTTYYIDPQITLS